MVTPRLGRKTGPKPKFTSEDAVMAALRLGIDRFTIAGVATQLGVATSAVYRLFDSRDALRPRLPRPCWALHDTTA